MPIRYLPMPVLATTLLTLLAGIVRADDEKHFDGIWDVTLSCPNSNGAIGYSFKLAAVVKDGQLHADKGTKGEPGWLQIDGGIPLGGHASLYADGLVGAAEAAVGHRPPGTRYGYHLDVQFNDNVGKGHRVEGRPCDVDFAKSH
jgi:hypothetical protein